MQTNLYIDLRLDAHVDYSLCFHPLLGQTSHQIYAPSKVALYYVVASNLIILTGENISKINDMNFINFTSRQATQLIVSDHSNWAHFVHKS